MNPIVLWTKGVYSCVLHRNEGRYELHLHKDGRVSHLRTANTEAEARQTAIEWAALVDASRATLDSGTAPQL